MSSTVLFPFWKKSEVQESLLKGFSFESSGSCLRGVPQRYGFCSSGSVTSFASSPRPQLLLTTQHRHFLPRQSWDLFPYTRNGWRRGRLEASGAHSRVDRSALSSLPPQHSSFSNEPRSPRKFGFSSSPQQESQYGAALRLKRTCVRT